MSGIRTSLLVPCYNSALFLPRLWDTVRAQTLPFDEAICYDDASDDNTAEIARSLGARVIRGEKNAGPAHARNQLWQAARGEWVHFHDADDLLAPRFLEKMLARTSPAIDVAICDVDWVDETSRRVLIPFRYQAAALRADPLGYVLEHPIGGINGLYRRSSLQAVNGFNEALRNWEDADLHVRLAASGARIDVVDEVLCLSLRQPASISTDYRLNWRCRLEALQGYARTLPPAAQAALAREAERAAQNLVVVGDVPAAGEALALARRLGGDPPTTRHWLLRLAKRFVPALWLLRLQTRARSLR